MTPCTSPHLITRPDALASLGWTGRDAEWITLVCLHSGVFVRSQFCYHYGCSRVSALRFLRRLTDEGVAAESALPGTRTNQKLCHIHARSLYRNPGHRGLAPPPQARRRRSLAPASLPRRRHRNPQTCPGSRPSKTRSATSPTSGLIRTCCRAASTPAGPASPPATSPGNFPLPATAPGPPSSTPTRGSTPPASLAAGVASTRPSGPPCVRPASRSTCTPSLAPGPPTSATPPSSRTTTPPPHPRGLCPAKKPSPSIASRPPCSANDQPVLQNWGGFMEAARAASPLRDRADALARGRAAYIDRIRTHVASRVVDDVFAD